MPALSEAEVTPRPASCATAREPATSTAAQPANSVPAALKNQFIAEIDRLQDGFKFVETVGALAEDVQQQVDFAR